MATGQILGLFMLACISTAARVHDVAVPNLLLDIYHTGMVAKCKLGKVAASMPTSFKAGMKKYHLTKSSYVFLFGIVWTSDLCYASDQTENLKWSVIRENIFAICHSLLSNIDKRR